MHDRCPRLVFLCCALVGISGLEIFGCSTENGKHLQEDWQRPVYHTTRTHHAPTHQDAAVVKHHAFAMHLCSLQSSPNASSLKYFLRMMKTNLTHAEWVHTHGNTASVCIGSVWQGFGSGGVKEVTSVRND